MSSDTAITTMDTSIIEKVMLVGDLAQLPPPQRVEYYNAVCRSLGLNPLTRPFEYIILDGKMTLYARRDATDQLRKTNGVSITIVGRERLGDVYVVTARATDPNGRADEATGVVPLVKEGGVWKKSQTGKSYFEGNGEWVEFRGSDLANALMKAETKAKRRVTLSICGLGWTDETELETIASAKPVRVIQETGEIVEGEAVKERPQLPAKTNGNGNGHKPLAEPMPPDYAEEAASSAASFIPAVIGETGWTEERVKAAAKTLGFSSVGKTADERRKRFSTLVEYIRYIDGGMPSELAMGVVNDEIALDAALAQMEIFPDEPQPATTYNE